MFAADVPRDPDFGAAVAATERPTIRSLRGQGHEVHEICAQHLGQRIRHGNLQHLLELPYRFRTVIRQRASATEFDLLHVNHGHSCLAALDQRRRKHSGVFVCRSHGMDDRMERSAAALEGEVGSLRADQAHGIVRQPASALAAPT